LSGNRITRTNSDSASLAGRVSESESGPLEIMVANILRSLKEAKADDRAKDIAQAAVRKPADAHFESDMVAWISNPSFVSKQRDEIDPLGDLNVGLKQLLEGVALNQSIALSSPEEFVGPEQTKDTGEKQAVGSPRSPRTALSWGWRVLAESMATILLALSWPGAMGHGSKSSKGNEERGLRKDECLG